MASQRNKPQDPLRRVSCNWTECLRDGTLHRDSPVSLWRESLSGGREISFLFHTGLQPKPTNSSTSSGKRTIKRGANPSPCTLSVAVTSSQLSKTSPGDTARPWSPTHYFMRDLFHSARCCLPHAVSPHSAQGPLGYLYLAEQKRPDDPVAMAQTSWHSLQQLLTEQPAFLLPAWPRRVCGVFAQEK